MPNVRKCSVSWCPYGFYCGYNGQKPPHLHFYSLPNDPELLEQWMIFLEEENPEKLPLPSKTTIRICSEHFPESMRVPRPARNAAFVPRKHHFNVRAAEQQAAERQRQQQQQQQQQQQHQQQLDLAAAESARQVRLRKICHHWLLKARRSLSRKRGIHDFPASVIPLSVKEHAQRWSRSKNDDAWEFWPKGKDLDIPDLKAMPAYPQITFAELIGAQAVHRYYTVKHVLRSTDLLYKLFVSVPEKCEDPACKLVDWWIRRTLKQNRGIICDDVEKGVYGIVSSVKVTSEVAVHASLQMVKGSNVLEKQTSLASGTSAILFSLSQETSIEESRSRLSTLLKSISKLPAVPLVIAFASPMKLPDEELDKMAVDLKLNKWLDKGAISVCEFMAIGQRFDLKYLSKCFNKCFNHMVDNWTPISEFDIVCLKDVLTSKLRTFFIFIQFTYNTTKIYPKDIHDPRVMIGLCNEWLDHMCREFVSSYHEAKDLCGEELWPFFRKGAFLPFLNDPEYEQLLQEIIRTVSLPPMEWPPSSGTDLERILTEWCSWLKRDDLELTSKRLSYLSGLNLSEIISRIPWVNLMQDWMEARINYFQTISGCEFLCLMRAQNVEAICTQPWWAQSKHLVSYLGANRSGREYEMDVDQTENTSLEDPNLSSVEQKEESSGLDNLKERTESVNELRKGCETPLSRLRSAVAADNGASSSEFQSNRSNESVKEFGTNTPAASFKYELGISFDIKAFQDLSSSNHVNIVLPEQERVGPSKKMDEIMASANDLLSSLNQKYKILEDVSTTAKITDLKLGFAKVDVCSISLSEKLHSSIYVAQSQARMMERLHGSTPENCQPSAHSDLDVLSDDRSMSPELTNASSPFGSGSEKSASDEEEKESCSNNSEYDDKMKSKKRLLSDDGDDDDSYYTASSQ